MKRIYWPIFLAIILLSLITMPAHGDHTDFYAVTHPTLTLTAPQNDGPLNKYAKRVFMELEKRIHIQLHIKQLPKQRALVDANSGEYDGVSMRVINLEKDYPNLVRIKQVIFNVQHVLFSYQDKIIQQTNNFDNLLEVAKRHDYKVGYLNGSKKAKDELAQFPDTLKMALGDPMQAFALLKVGRISAYLAGPGIVNRQIFSKHYSDSNIKEVGVFARFPLYIYVHKKHVALVEKLESGMKDMHQDGTLSGIRTALEQMR